MREDPAVFGAGGSDYSVPRGQRTHCLESLVVYATNHNRDTFYFEKPFGNFEFL